MIVMVLTVEVKTKMANLHTTESFVCAHIKLCNPLQRLTAYSTSTEGLHVRNLVLYSLLLFHHYKIPLYFHVHNVSTYNHSYVFSFNFAVQFYKVYCFPWLMSTVFKYQVSRFHSGKSITTEKPCKV